jgi:hypothetical protein
VPSSAGAIIPTFLGLLDPEDGHVTVIMRRHGVIFLKTLISSNSLIFPNYKNATLIIGIIG